MTAYDVRTQATVGAQAMILVYTQTKHPQLTDGREFRNPRFFTGTEKASRVIIVGDWPEIARLYREAAVDVTEVGQQHDPQLPAAAPIDRSAVVIPDDWEELTWPQIRRLANEVSGEVVLNKTQALAAIQAEVDRRAGPDLGSEEA